MDKRRKPQGLQWAKDQVPGVGDSVALDEFMKVNNELVNAQRELHLRNVRLARQEARFLKLIQDNPDLIFVVDQSGQLLFANHAAQSFLGIAPAGPLNTDFLIPGGKEIDLLDKDGILHVMDLLAVETLWDEAPARLFFLRDVTERKQLEAIREDIYRISQHDLKTPLNAIINLPEILLGDGNLTADQRESIEWIRKAGTRMLSLINITLHLFQMETGQYQPAFVPVDLLRVVRTVLADLDSLRRRKKISVEVLLSGLPATQDDSFIVLGEKLLCQSILSNLVKNALEASPPGNTVTIGFDRNEDRLVRISNAGEIGPELTNRFFEKYFTSNKKGGTGLGTYSARLMARALGGELELDTSEPGTIAVILRWPAEIGR